MLLSIKIFTIIAISFSIVSLLYQLFVAIKDGKKDYSQQAGSRLKAIIYNFTFAMSPRYKETVKNHPVKFLIGLTMHIGAFIAIIKVINVIATREYNYSSQLLIIIWSISLIASLYLMINRMFDKNLKHLSSVEDYLSILFTIGLISMSLLSEMKLASNNVFLIYASMFFIYLPLGKLKHVLFFFLARYDFGLRAGYRGVYQSRRKK